MSTPAGCHSAGVVQNFKTIQGYEARPENRFKATAPSAQKMDRMERLAERSAVYADLYEMSISREPSEVTRASSLR